MRRLEEAVAVAQHPLIAGPALGPSGLDILGIGAAVIAFGIGALLEKLSCARIFSIGLR